MFQCVKRGSGLSCNRLLNSGAMARIAFNSVGNRFAAVFAKVKVKSSTTDVR